jgi:hypothetical protein
MELPCYKILRSFHKKNKHEKTLESQIHMGMFFLVFAGNTAISKEKDTEKENVPLKTLKIVKASK